MSKYDAVIVGAGISGLIAAKELEAYKLKTLVLDKEAQVGGRLKTDHYDGYVLDHGFQVLLTAYPMVKKHLDLRALRLKTFSSGALVFGKQKCFKVVDVKRNPGRALGMLFSPVGSLTDKLKMARLRKEVMAKSIDEIYALADVSTLDYLKDYGFSNKIIERFFRPFFGGIFLERDLKTSARQFLFVFKMFSEGEAALPAKGMAEIAYQLKSKLEITEFRLNTEVKKVEAGKVELSDGSIIEASQIIIAGDPAQVMAQVNDDMKWNDTFQAYFEAPSGMFAKDLIALSFGEESIINNIACLSAVQPKYASKSKQLYSVSLRKDLKLTEKELQMAIREELQDYIGSAAQDWVLIRTYSIPRALPVVEQVAYERSFEETRLSNGIYIAGDQMLNPSLNAAMLSGELAAKALILNHQAQ